MIKKISLYFIILILLLGSSISFAESNLDKFENMLKGVWENKIYTENYLYDTGVDGNHSFHYGFLNIYKFSYPDGRFIALHPVPSNGEQVRQAEAEIYLTEDSNGVIYLIIYRKRGNLFNVGKISFNSDGTLLLIIPESGNDYLLYEKKNQW